MTIVDPKFSNQIHLPVSHKLPPAFCTCLNLCPPFLQKHYTSQSGIISQQSASSQDIFKISKITMIKNILISNYHYFLHFLAIVYFIFATRYYTASFTSRCSNVPKSDLDCFQFHFHNAQSTILETSETCNVPDQCSLQFCNGYGFLLLLFAGFYAWFLVARLLQPVFGDSVSRTLTRTSRRISEVAQCSTGCR